MLEKYYKYKLDYKEYLIFIKCGTFYECLDNDALIMNKVFNYKLKRLSNTFKLGFPINSLNNVLNKIEKININYLVIDNDIISKKTFSNNTYSNYNFNDKIIFYNSLRIEKIINYLNDNLITENFDVKLKKIENIIES